MQEVVPYKVKATYIVEVEEEVLARTPEEAESLLESGGSERIEQLKEVLGAEAELLEVFAYPEDEEI